MTLGLPSNATADAIIAKDAETIAATDDITGGNTTKAEGVHSTEPLNYVPPRNNNLIYEVKAAIVKAAGALGDVLRLLGLTICTK